MNTLSLGFSPCPNDTFIFYALVHGLIDVDGFALEPPQLADVEMLNQWAFAGRLDITKMSFHAFGHVQDRYCLLSSGGALGRGCGPLLIVRPERRNTPLADLRIAIPGRYTTAAMLLRLFAPSCTQLSEMRFDTIINAVAAGNVDAGVIIHESRFTYQQHGLLCLKDLGKWWEETFALPIPLGCIAARRSLGKKVIAAVDRAIRASVDYGFANREACSPYIKSHSQELADQVIASHIDLYVNDFSKNLGVEGLAAVEAFLVRGRKEGILPPCDSALQEA